MKIFNKLKNKRGTTFVEVMIVIAVLSIMLGLAVPNILSQSQEIKLAALDGYARSVAVAVQSKLYGMKNNGTALGSEYYMLNSLAADTTIKTEDGEKTVKYFANFGNTSQIGAQILSGALTDAELLQKGKIVVVYYPPTADVVEVFYSEKEFPVDENNGNLFPTVSEPYLKRYQIGIYRGDPKPEIEYNVGLPNFTIVWQYDDEMYLQLQMSGEPDPSLYAKNLGLEVFALIPDPKDREKEAEILLYAEGMFATDYGANIKADYGTLTIEKIQGNKGILRFALDSLITKSANWGSAGPYLRHQSNPNAITVADNVLYPRETVANWFDKSINPYLDFGKNEGLTSDEVYDSVEKSKSVTEIINVDETVYLRVELHVLSEETHAAKGETSALLRGFDDEHFGSIVRISDKVNPYFYALSSYSNMVTLSSMRDLNNLSYLFQTKNDINRATLSANIEEQELQDKFIKVRQALMKKSPEAAWGYGANGEAGTITPSVCVKENFTLSGKRADGQGCYYINCFRLGRDPNPGGLFTYAENCTFEDLDIINPKIRRNGTIRNFLLQEDSVDPTRLTGLNISWWDSTASGALVGIAVNCRFKNVHAYLDPEKTLQIEIETGGKLPEGVNQYKVTGTVVGGLVGIAIGSGGKETTFESCAASLLVDTEVLIPTSECIYAGGLVGLAFGDVQIKDSYAASQISGYYAGGLVGGTGSGNWNYINQDYNPWLTKNGTANGTLTIQDSFAAGNIMYNVRVGGGLIGHVGTNNKPDVSGCYSAVQWQILPPVAYGTFKGDNANYYLYQKEFDFPVTANVLARFESTGSVFSMQIGQSGIPCSKQILEAKLREGGNAAGWTNATSTKMWSWKELNQNKDPAAHPTTPYPFPMPAGNTDFYGEWILSYDENSTMKVPDAEISFKEFRVAYYYLWPGEAIFRYADAGEVAAFSRTITLTEDKTAVMVNDTRLKADGVTFEEGGNLSGVYWAGAQFGDDMFGQGADGATRITAQNGKFDFYSAPYYSPDYNAVKGSAFFPTPSDSFSYGKTASGSLPLMWDYCGFYFIDYGNNDLVTRYYISCQSTVARGQAVADYNGTTLDGKEFKKIAVNETEFKEALHYSHIQLSGTGTRLLWNKKDGYFYVADEA